MMAAGTEKNKQTKKDAAKAAVFNVPNQLTALRLILSIALFVLIGWAQSLPESAAETIATLYLISMITFVVAAGTDWIDGYWARKYGQVTTLGRIFDPFVDKIIICGTFIFLVASPASGITAWMATVVVGRELLVTALRGFVEQQGGDFSANMAGKLKMVLQCMAATGSLYALTYIGARPQWVDLTVAILIWSAILLTIYSGVGYVFTAARMLSRS